MKRLNYAFIAIQMISCASILPACASKLNEKVELSYALDRFNNSTGTRTVHFNEADSIKTFKARIEKQVGIPATNQEVYIWGLVYPDDVNLVRMLSRKQSNGDGRQAVNLRVVYSVKAMMAYKGEQRVNEQFERLIASVAIADSIVKDPYASVQQISVATRLRDAVGKK